MEPVQKQKYENDYAKEFTRIKQGKDDFHAYCIPCNAEINLTSMGKEAIRVHQEKSTHKKNIKVLKNNYAKAFTGIKRGKDDFHAYCIPCEAEINLTSMGKEAIRVHQERPKHKENVKRMGSDTPVTVLDRCRARLQIKNERMVRFISEFFGTAMLLFIGLGIVFQFILSGEKLNLWININVGWGFALMFCVYAISQTSGGHMNPAVSLLMVTLGNLSVADFFIYSIVQTAGAFFGASLTYIVYFDQLQHFAGDLRTVTGPNATLGLFCSNPPMHLSNTGAFIDQIAGTALLTLCLAIVIDKRNKIPDFLHPMFFGFMLMMIGTAYGMNLGYPINPARDFGPRLFAYFIGYGGQVFSYHNYYFWVPIVAPFIGALLGSWTYHIAVGFHIKEPKTPISPKIQMQNGKEEEMERLA